MTSHSPQNSAETGIKNYRPLTSYDPKFSSDFHSLRHKPHSVQ